MFMSCCGNIKPFAVPSYRMLLIPQFWYILCWNTWCILSRHPANSYSSIRAQHRQGSLYVRSESDFLTVDHTAQVCCPSLCLHNVHCLFHSIYPIALAIQYSESENYVLICMSDNFAHCWHKASIRWVFHERMNKCM